jgi:transcriptional regulator with XRE-family HTH domain
MRAYIAIMTLGEKLARLARQNGWDQNDVAERVHVSTTSMSRYYNDVRLPEAVTVLALARLFGVSTDYLLRDEVEDPGAIITDCPFDVTDLEFTRRIGVDEAKRRLYQLPAGVHPGGRPSSPRLDGVEPPPGSNTRGA